MARHFTIKADRMAIVEAFARNEFEGATISAPPNPNLRSVPKPGEPVLAFDSAENILHFIVHLSDEVGVGVFSAWLYDLLRKSGSRKTTLNEHLVPHSPSEIAALLRNVEARAVTQRPKLPSSTKAYFIKLGRGGDWEKQCLADGILKFGYRETPHELCLKGDWNAVREVWLPLRKCKTPATCPPSS